MSRYHSHRAPDFFAVLVIMVVIGFSLTLAIQVSVSDRENVVETEVAQQVPSAG